jgi:hypothetical protein
MQSIKSMSTIQTSYFYLLKQTQQSNKWSQELTNKSKN